ncbi:hypothetical protein [Bacteroidetes bacterium endosymbiont of Geopemphigus sp.]|uniref:hypothetical protein n=1 Tax=Bacteroidetes bacterium endosymbiont of Geopemphigus sp. TaxID=2047937 RepID=UPI000CD26621|nr:hypothetical protein [Bacteroidetes bacterium endosymbiont of Geopemphigus sp.]
MEFFIVDQNDNKVEGLSLNKKLLEFPKASNTAQENRYALSFGSPDLNVHCWRTSYRTRNSSYQLPYQGDSVYRKINTQFLSISPL